LLGYSEKLWGLPCRALSPAIAGARLRGLGVLAVLKELLPGRRQRAHHLDGTFLYPHRGIGRLTDRLAEACGEGVIHLNARVTRVVHDGRRITSVVVNGHDRHDVEAVVSTLPLSSLVQMLDPAPPRAVLEAAGGLRWRHVLLVALFLRRGGVTPCATVYFPDRTIPFTRVYEPRNRSARMAPPGHTSLVAEIPFDEDSPEEIRDPNRAIAAVRRSLEKVGWLREGEVIGCEAAQLPHAYPVLDLTAPARLSLIRAHLASFENLRLAGRPGMFAYSHLHDQIEQGQEAVLSLRGQVTTASPIARRTEMSARSGEAGCW
jgi:protoporphyrinogen oxidase